jgi:diphthine-ammonia ligase
MIDAGVEAVLIKVAALGLDPKRHLGKSIAELFPTLCQLNETFGIHICGEGGEYETFTLDCPLFKKRIRMYGKKKEKKAPSHPFLFTNVRPLV